MYSTETCGGVACQHTACAETEVQRTLDALEGTTVADLAHVLLTSKPDVMLLVDQMVRRAAQQGAPSPIAADDGDDWAGPTLTREAAETIIRQCIPVRT